MAMTGRQSVVKVPFGHTTGPTVGVRVGGSIIGERVVGCAVGGNVTGCCDGIRVVGCSVGEDVAGRTPDMIWNELLTPRISKGSDSVMAITALYVESNGKSLLEKGMVAMLSLE